jgi:hypothetical protein
MVPLVKTKRQANFKDFKRFGAFKGDRYWPRYFSTLGRRLAIVAGSSVLGGVSERISQTRKTRR